MGGRIDDLRNLILARSSQTDTKIRNRNATEGASPLFEFPNDANILPSAVAPPIAFPHVRSALFGNNFPVADCNALMAHYGIPNPPGMQRDAKQNAIALYIGLIV